MRFDIHCDEFMIINDGNRMDEYEMKLFKKDLWILTIQPKDNIVALECISAI